MPKISVEIPGELLDDLDGHVGDDGKFVNRSDAVRASIRKTLDVLDDRRAPRPTRRRGRPRAADATDRDDPPEATMSEGGRLGPPAARGSRPTRSTAPRWPRSG